MPSFSNIFTDSLDALTYEDIFSALTEIGQEGTRLDFKADFTSKRKIAHLAAAMANGLGGLVVAGIKDTNITNGKIEAVDSTLDTSDKRQTGLVNTIQSLVYPALFCETKGYVSASDQSRRMLILRVAQSIFAPHEYIGGDESVNLPIRRDKEVRSLTLAEIAALQGRQKTSASESPLGKRTIPGLSISRTVDRPEFFFGIQVTPETYRPDRIILEKADDETITRIIHRGANCNTMHPEIKADGLHFKNVPGEFERDQTDRQLIILSDGQCIIRFQETPSTRAYQLSEVLANAYFVTSQIYRHLRLPPRVNALITFRLKPDYRPYAGELVFPTDYDDYFKFDVSRDTYADIALDIMLRTLRFAGASFERSEVRALLEGVWQREFGSIVGGDLRRDWIGL